MEDKHIKGGKGIKFEKELPAASFSRPDIPFRCEIGRVKMFPPFITCHFDEYLPAYGENCEMLNKRRGFSFETVTLFFPEEAIYLMPPYKVLSEEEYGAFDIYDRDGLKTRFIRKFRYMSNLDDVQSRLKVSRIFQKMFEKFPDKSEDHYLINETIYNVRRVIADNPIVKINDKNEIIDGPF